MEPVVAAVSLLAAIAAVSGTVHSFRQMRQARSAELQLRQLLAGDPKFRQELRETLTKDRVGDRALEELETRMSYLLLKLPRERQYPVRAALKQASRRGLHDYMLKLAADDTGH